MDKFIGVITSNYLTDTMQEIAQHRPPGAIPFGGRYRLLDFGLSSMVNSGIRTVGIITPHTYRPLLDHLGAGKEWFLNRKKGGLFILPGLNHGLAAQEIKFYLKDFSKNIEFLELDSAEHVIVTSCNRVYNSEYREAMAFHENTSADITMLYKDIKMPLQINSSAGQGNGYFIEIMIIKKKLLIEICKGYNHIENIDLVDVISENTDKLKVYAFPFNGYLGNINSVKSYYECSLDLLKPEIRKELFMGTQKIHTKVKDNPPTRYGSEALVKDSLVASGCTIDGNVERSIIFRGVEVMPGAQVKNSILMQKCIIGRDVVLENVILDKMAQVTNKVVVKGQDHSPVVIKKKSII